MGIHTRFRAAPLLTAPFTPLKLVSARFSQCLAGPSAGSATSLSSAAEREAVRR